MYWNEFDFLWRFEAHAVNAVKPVNAKGTFISTAKAYFEALFLLRLFRSPFSPPSVYKPSQNATKMYDPRLNHLRHDYLIKYAYLVECYLERFASIGCDPEKQTTHMALDKKKNT